MAGTDLVRSMGPRKEYPTWPGRAWAAPSTSRRQRSMYSNLFRAAEIDAILHGFVVLAVVSPGLTPCSWLPFHQSQAVLPGLIQEVSAMALGGFKLTTMFDSTSRPG